MLGFGYLHLQAIECTECPEDERREVVIATQFHVCTRQLVILEGFGEVWTERIGHTLIGTGQECAYPRFLQDLVHTVELLEVGGVTMYLERHHVRFGHLLQGLDQFERIVIEIV